MQPFCALYKTKFPKLNLSPQSRGFQNPYTQLTCTIHKPNFTIQACSYIQEHFRLASLHICHGNAGIDGARDSPADDGHGTLMDANCSAIWKELPDFWICPVSSHSWKKGLLCKQKNLYCLLVIKSPGKDGRNPLRACPCNVTAFIHNTVIPTFSLICY